MTHLNKNKLIHTFGFVLIALGIANIVKAKLGASPIDAFNYYLHQIFVKIIPILTLGSVIIFTGIMVTLLTYAISKDKKLIISAVFLVVVGVFVDLWLFLLGFVPDVIITHLVTKIFMASIGLLLCAFGVSITILTGLPTSPYESLMLVIYQKIKNLSISKMIVEGSFFVFAVILGLYTKNLFDQVYIFTVVMTFTMGLFVSFFTNILKNKMNKGEISYGVK